MEEQALTDRQSAQNEYAANVLALKEEVATLVIDLRRYSQTIKAKTAQIKSDWQTKEAMNGRYREGLATYDRGQTIYRLKYLQGMSK